jgi:hypothetical protein
VLEKYKETKMSIKNEKKILELLENYSKKKEDLWEYGNTVLYNMCKEKPLHNERNVVASKVWLIGRSYAAAIERVKEDISADKIYSDFLNEIIAKSSHLDANIQSISKTENIEILDRKLVFETHLMLTDILKKVTGLEKRSLASKYLHFHCPNAFFIYDSRARSAINSLVTKADISEYIGDCEYVEFYLRVLELQKFIEQKTGRLYTPREIDNLLVFNKGDF